MLLRAAPAATARTDTVLTVGNAAKLYCLQVADALAVERSELRIVDLGSGDGKNWVAFLRRHPHATYLGIDPSREACERARALLPADRAQVVQARAYDPQWGTADVVVSFSVLEHVYRRRRYVEAIAATLAQDGVALVNYDSGHFRHPIVRDRVKNALGPPLARVGFEGWYQSFVREAEFRRLVEEAGMRVLEARSFNTAAKELYRHVRPEKREPYMRAWLAFELAAEDVVDGYDDGASGVFRTRNFVLGLAGQG